MFRRASAVLLTGIMLQATSAATVPAVLASAPTIPTFQLKWGEGGSGPGQFNIHAGIAADALGDVYVADTGNHRIQKFDRLGNFITRWGSSGSGDGQFDSPQGIAIGPTGTVYVLDYLGNRVQRFDASGAYLGQWGSTGWFDGQFQNPEGIAVDAAGNVYVADTGNDRIEKFTSSGAFLMKWGSCCTGDGQLYLPTNVAFDPDGSVYVAERGNFRVQKFTNTGGFITKFGSMGTGPGQFQCPNDIAVDAAGDVHVLDLFNPVQKFSATGTYLAQWGGWGSGDEQFNAPRGIELDAEGNFYVATDIWVKKFSSAGTALTDVAPGFLLAAGTSGNGNGQFNPPVAVAADAYGNYFVSDQGNNRVQKFNGTGGYLTQFGSAGTGPSQLSGPAGLAAWPRDDRVAVVDAGNNRIVVFEDRGSGFAGVSATGTSGTGPGQFNNPHGVAIGPNGVLYVTDFFNHRVQKFTWTGTNLVYAAQWGSNGFNPGQFSGPSGVAVDSAGNVYVSEYFGNRVQKFDANGNYLLRWGIPGSGPGQFNNPIGVTVDGRFNVYVSDYSNGRVQKFTSNGTYLSEIQPLSGPRDPAVDPAGNLYVPEAGAYRVKKFVSPPTIALVSDIGNDQGLQTRLRVLRGSTDFAGSGSTIVRYDVFRRIDPLPAPAVLARGADAAPAGAALAGWEQVGTFSAYGESEYNVVVPTLVNTTASSLQYSAFMVRAATGSPFTFYDSATEYGSSVDNLSPPAPTPFTAAYVAGATHLHWSESLAPDFGTFRLYRGTTADFVPDPTNLVAATTDTGYVDVGGAGSYYKLAAVDWNGNQSLYAMLGPGQTLDAPGEDSTLELALEEIRPNPIHGRDLVARFALPTGERARIELIDVAGRRVLQRDVSGAGRHVLSLGRDRGLPSGIYLVRLSQGSSLRVRRVVVID